MSPARILALLSIEDRAGPEMLRLASIELLAAGVELSAEDMIATLRTVRADRNSVTGEWVVPGGVRPTFAYDDLQAVLSAAGLRGPALWRAWSTVKGRLRVRWARGDHSKPSDRTVRVWAGVAKSIQPEVAAWPKSSPLAGTSSSGERALLHLHVGATR